MREQRAGDTWGGYGEVLQYVPTPRQARLERGILEALRTSGTRSELRDLVIEFTDYLRVRGITADRAISSLRALGARATPQMIPDDVAAVGDSAADRIGMMIRWCTARYFRAD
ncbi:MAG: hypothetical protein ABJE47_06795 [bacterium]